MVIEPGARGAIPPTIHRDCVYPIRPFKAAGRARRGEQAQIDFWVILDLVMRHWKGLTLGSLCFGALFFQLATRFIGYKYTASASLLRYNTPGISDVFKSATVVSPDTFAGLLRSRTCCDA